ncbi:unnamed protein product [Closterium sp. NIES-54]
MGSDDEVGPAVPTRAVAPLKRKPFKSLHLLNPAGPAPPRPPPLHPAPGSTANPRARFNAPAAAASVTCNAKAAPGAAAGEAAAADSTRYYSVMYCPRKPHAKRKGPWSDGLLSVKGRAVAVQNMDAKSVAKASVSGCANLKEGSTLEVLAHAARMHACTHALGADLLSSRARGVEGVGDFCGDVGGLVGKWEVEVMHEVPREQYLAGSFFIPAAAAAAAAAAVTSAAATGRAGSGAVGKGRKRAGESSSGRAAGSSAEGVLANKRAASIESRMRLGNEDAVCLNPNQNGKGISKIYLDPYIGARMRPHQVEGVRFMLEAVLEVRTPGCSGCVLADEMGLGKTLQVIALMWTLLKQGPQGRPFLRKAVVVCPSSLVDNWGAEFRKWLGTERLKAMVVNSSFSPTEVKGKMVDFKHAVVWPVLITSYDLLRRHAPLLAAAAPQLLVCDEGHRLKNCAGNKTISALHQLGCPHKVLLTGTPMQNDLSEFFALLDLVNPGCLGPLPAFRRIFADPIQKSRDRSATEEEVRVGEARSQELQAKAAAFVLRRTAAVNAAYLPPKSEYIVFCRLHAQQARQYSDFLRSTHVRSLLYATAPGTTGSALTAICHLRKLCLHPALAASPTPSSPTPSSPTPSSPRPRSPSPAASASAGSSAAGEEGGDEEEWGRDEEQEEVEEEEQGNAEWAAEGGEVGGCEGGLAGGNEAGQKRNGFRAPSMLPEASPSAQGAPLSRTAAAAAFAAVLKALGADAWRLSGKLHVLALLLQAILGGGAAGVGGGEGSALSSITDGSTDTRAHFSGAAAAGAGGGSIGDKVVIVSNFTRALDVIEAMCESHGWKTTRLDGSTEAATRQALVCAFNTGRDGSCCFLLSSKAGGAGLNLVGANRLVLFDPDWNPANDHQAMARVWRDGQSKPVVIYRMLATGSIEEKIFQRQLMKGDVASAVGDGTAPPGTGNAGRGGSGGGGSGSSKSGAGYFTKEELHELFTLEQATTCDTLDLLLRSNSPLSAKWLAAAATTTSGAPGADTISSTSVSSVAAGGGVGGGRGGLAAGIADGPLREVVGMCEGVTFVYHDSCGSPGSRDTPTQGARARGDGMQLAGQGGSQHNSQAAGGSKEEEEREEDEHAVLRGAAGGGVERGRSTEHRAEEQGSDGRGGGAAVELLTFDALEGVSDDVMDLFGSNVF